MNNNERLRNKILQVVGYTESSTFGELCRGLDDLAPEDRASWGRLFKVLDDMQDEGLIEAETVWRNNRDEIEAVQLTEEGAALARDLQRR